MPVEIPPPGTHGGDAGRIAAALGVDPADLVDLSASMNPVAPDVRQLAVRRLDALRAYPHPAHATGELAAAIGVPADRLVLTNGGAEAIALVAAQLGEGWLVEPEFSLYRRHLARVHPGAPRWRSNPSNPLGLLAAPDEQATVWDEAYYPLVTGRWTRGDDAAWRLGSLTKLWHCAGLRLGYLIAPDAERADVARRQQPEWSVNSLALALVGDLLARTDLTGWAATLAALKAELAAALSGLGFALRAPDANWLLVEGDDLRTRLAHQHVVVRDCTSYGMPGVVRVAVPGPGDLPRVVAAFAAIPP